MAITTIKDLIDKVNSSSMIDVSLTEWRPILAEECQVYVFGENYLAKRFDQIHYKFCEKNEAKEILVDNLYALLRFKYFPKLDEVIDKRIEAIVQSFVANIKTTLKKVSFDEDTDAFPIKMIPDGCIAFRNGVFNFMSNQWLFKYEVVFRPELANRMYLYPTDYVVLWYMNYDFNPLPINIGEDSLETFIEVMKELTKTNRNFCFELLYNISHDEKDEFSLDRFKHLCEILGYTCLQSFSQSFVLLIGSGQNGKNSLFDGCFSNRVIPRPAANDMDAIENDRFITGSLENKAHNIFLETSAKTYSESKMIKALTGSMYQTIESKGISKYSGLINCKYVFAGNDQEKIKFSDNTTGFRRRINVFEIWYRWDAQKRFLKKGDYYDTTFSDSLYELKNDSLNTSAYIYFAMYGLLSATKGLTRNFKFSYNDWKLQYSDVDFDLKDRIESISLAAIVRYMKSSERTLTSCKTLFFDLDKKRLYLSPTIRELGYDGYEGLLKLLESGEESSAYFSEHDVYINIRLLQTILGDLSPASTFTQSLKKVYSLMNTPSLYNNQPYVKCTFAGNKLKILT